MPKEGAKVSSYCTVSTPNVAKVPQRLTAVKFPVQMVNAGAVLNGTGKQAAHWVQVVAGAHPVWLLLANTRPV